MKYLLEGNTSDGFPINEVVGDMAECKRLCRAYGLDPLACCSKTNHNVYTCDYCGIYHSVKPRCNKCEIEAL